MGRVPANVWVPFVTTAALAWTVGASSPSQTGTLPDERVLAELPGTILGGLQTSPDNRHVFVSVRLTESEPDAGTWAVYRDGALVGQYDGAMPDRPAVAGFRRPGVDISFSPDGEHYGFIATRGGQSFVVVDGVEGPHHDVVSQLHLGADGRVAYVVGQSPAQRLVTNEGVGPGVYSVGIAATSPDGRHLAHVVYTGTFGRLLRDGKDVLESVTERGPTTGYRAIQWVRFSPDSQRLTFVAESDEGDRVVLDEATIGIYPSAGWLTFSPDSQRLAFVVSQGSEPISVVVDGTEHPFGADGGLTEQGRYTGSRVLWSPDSRHYAYVVTRGPALAIVHDGVETRSYQRLARQSVRFLDDGRLVYSAFDGSRWTTYIGTETVPDRRLAGITPDGEHRAYFVGDSDRELDVDGVRYQAPHDVVSRWFSGPRGRAFVATNLGSGSPGLLMVGTSVLKHVGLLSFSADEAHYAVIDNESGAVYVNDAPIMTPGAQSIRFAFDGNGRYHAFALRGNRLVRVDGTVQ